MSTIHRTGTMAAAQKATSPPEIRPKAYSYIRMSTKEQLEGDSLRRQLEVTRRFADERGLELVEKYDDMGVSAYRGLNADKGALHRFRRAVEDGEIPVGSFLIIESMDRLTRQAAMQAVNLLYEIIESGVTVVTLDDRMEYSKGTLEKNYGHLFIAIGAFIRAHDESRRKSDLNTAAWTNKRRALRKDRAILTTMVPAWLKADRSANEIVVIPERAQIVQEIFDLTCNGYGIYSIARLLNERGEPAWGRPRSTKVRQKNSPAARPIWRDSYIKKILSNRAVLGEFQPHRYQQLPGGRSKRVPDGDPVIGYYPRVISDEVFTRAQIATARRRTGAKGRKGRYYSNLLTGLIHCWRCGGAMRYLDKGSDDGKGKYLRCSVSVSGAGCYPKAYKYEIVEQTILEFLSHLDVEKVLGGEATATRLAELRQRRELSEIDLDSIKKKIDHINDALMASVERLPTLPTSTIKALSELAKEQRELEAELQAINDQIEEQLSTSPGARKAALEKLLLAIRDGSEDSLESRRRALAAELHRLVESVTIKPHVRLPHEIEIDDSSEMLEIVKYSGRTKLDHFLEDFGFELTIKYRNGHQQVVDAALGTDLKLRWSSAFADFKLIATYQA